MKNKNSSSTSQIYARMQIRIMDFSWLAHMLSRESKGGFQMGTGLGRIGEARVPLGTDLHLSTWQCKSHRRSSLTSASFFCSQMV